MTDHPECWQDLANAVIFQAVEDYRAVCGRLRRRPGLPGAAEARLSLEAFFTSRWFGILSSADGKALLEEVKASMKTNEPGRRRPPAGIPGPNGPAGQRKERIRE